MPVLNSQDPLWDIRAQEKAHEEALRRQIDQLERAVALGKRALAIRNAPGYQDFVKAIHGIREGLVAQLASTNAVMGDSELRELRGRCHALADVLAILGKSDMAVEELAARAAKKQNDLEMALKRRPKPKPDEVSS
jgi:hypothetical protein